MEILGDCNIGGGQGQVEVAGKLPGASSLALSRSLLFSFSSFFASLAPRSSCSSARVANKRSPCSGVACRGCLTDARHPTLTTQFVCKQTQWPCLFSFLPMSSASPSALLSPPHLSRSPSLHLASPHVVLLCFRVSWRPVQAAASLQMQRGTFKMLTNGFLLRGIHTGLGRHHGECQAGAVGGCGVVPAAARAHSRHWVCSRRGTSFFRCPRQSAFLLLVANSLLGMFYPFRPLRGVARAPAIYVCTLCISQGLHARARNVSRAGNELTSQSSVSQRRNFFDSPSRDETAAALAVQGARCSGTRRKRNVVRGCSRCAKSGGPALPCTPVICRLVFHGHWTTWPADSRIVTSLPDREEVK